MSPPAHYSAAIGRQGGGELAVPNFIAKSTAADSQCLATGAGPVIAQFAALRDGVIALKGRPAAALFTEPVLSRKNGGLEIAWYSDHPGAPTPLKALDSDARTVVVERLRERLATLAPLLGDASVGPALARALYIQSADDIFALGQEPVLVNWAVLPPEIAHDDQQALDRNFAATLGPYAPFEAPRLVARRSAAPVGRPAPPIIPSPPPRPAPRLEAVGLLIATGIAAALTLLLNLPGILAYPAAAPIGGSGDAALEAQRAITKAMQEKIAAAAAALKAATCNPDGTLKINLPDGGKAELAPKQIPARPKPGDSQGDMAHVADVATQSVVLVVAFQKEEPKAPSPDSSKGAPDGKPEPDDGVPVKTGSGFFIGPGIIVTNAHVIDGAESIFVTNHFLGKAQKATVKYRTGALSLFEPDFAVLETASENSPPAVTLSPTAARLMNVVSAGFPGVVDEWDPQYKKLLHGDENAAPEVTTFPGFVTLIQEADGALPRIVHSATIGHGNSGGPLLDLCGRALGVNTLKNTRDDDIGYVVSNALASKGLMAFLDANHVAYQQSSDACQPAAPAPSAKIPESDGGKPAPDLRNGAAIPPPDKK
jgi:S1-C subfamily serine protease